MRKSELRTRLKDLTDEFIKADDDPNITIVLCALQGALYSGDDTILAIYVQELIENELMPRLDERKKSRLN